MVKSPHEALHRIFQEDATLFARAFARILEVDFPRPRAVSVINSDLTEVLPIERPVDTPLLVETDDGDHVVIIESQSQPSRSPRSVSVTRRQHRFESTDGHTLSAPDASAAPSMA